MIRSWSNYLKLGFTLIELLVVITIIGIVSTFLIINFSKVRVDVNRVVPQIVADIRDTQTMAAASAKFKNRLRCGYGITFLSKTSYRIFTTLPADSQCVLYHDYQTYGGVTVSDVSIAATNIQFMSSFPDIYFESPDPKTYISAGGALNGPPASIILGPNNLSGAITPPCTGNPSCKTICVYPSGKIDIIAAGGACPDL